MIQLPEPLAVLKQSFSRFSGVGEKSALRMVLQVVEWTPLEVSQMVDSLHGLSRLGRCRQCCVYCDGEICSICASPQRGESQTLCVVENINDLLAIERSEHYHGRYHVLGGTLNPLRGVGPEQLELSSLVERAAKVKNIILAINPSVEGDATCSYIKGELGSAVRVERIGMGLPMGGSLEYVDAMTISKALENRRDF